MREKKRPQDDRVEVLSHKTIYRGYFRIDEYRFRHKLHEGGWTGEIRREIFERGHAAAILMFDPERDCLVLAEQFRAGALAAGWDPWLIEVAAGIIEDGESAEEVVRREALEETGCAVTEVVHIQDYLASPGGSSEAVSVFCGKVDSAGAGGIHGLADEQEDIRVLVVPYAEAIDRLDAGRVTNAGAIIALGWLARHHDEIVERWRAKP
jgi:ADP-ribose pyrophosphatase